MTSANNSFFIRICTFKSIEMIIHYPLSSAFLEGNKSLLHPVSLQNSAIMECPLSYTVWDEPWSERDICICTSKSGQQQFAMGTNIYFSQGVACYARLFICFSRRPNLYIYATKCGINTCMCARLVHYNVPWSQNQLSVLAFESFARRIILA